MVLARAVFLLCVGLDKLANCCSSSPELRLVSAGDDFTDRAKHIQQENKKR